MITEFTPAAAVAGGMLIGVAAVMLMAFNGRIAGVSGMIAGVLMPSGRSEAFERGAFLLGLVLAPLLFASATGTDVPLNVTDNIPLIISAGLLVGVGTAYGNGCTSGHGVCGIARLSQRSMVATAVFIGMAMLTVAIMRHVLQ